MDLEMCGTCDRASSADLSGWVETYEVGQENWLQAIKGIIFQ